jgi:CheY-like chemotaxis protein
MSDVIAIYFSVTDTGIGIRPEDIEKLFEDYTQLDSGVDWRTKGSMAEGTGLGLPISKKLAELMDGSITVESEHGEGSCFAVQIMQEQSDTGTIGVEAASNLRNMQFTALHQGEKIEYVSLSGVKILAVDDIPENLTAIKKMLAPYDIIVDTASTGLESIKKIKIAEYDLIFMDHMMPEMDGIETLKQMRNEQAHLRSEEMRNGKQTPIVMLTASAMSGMREYYLKQGFDDYLSKPINTKELDDLLKKWLATPEMEAKLIDRLKHYNASLKIKNEIISEELTVQDDALVNEKLAKLKESFMANELEKAEMLIYELGNLQLNTPLRKLYYILHNCILTENTQKALEEINKKL